jgi:hypothetical protein
MTISSPITLTPPPITHKDGTVKTFSPITLTSLDIVYTDDPQQKIVRVQIRPCPLPLTLWSGAAYDAIGNWTEAQAETQITTLLGANPAAVLLGLYPMAH